MPEPSPEITVVCHVRAPLLLEPVDRQIETLRACESEGAIDDLLLRSWPKEVTRSETSTHQEVLEVYDRLSTWATARGVSIEPPFRERSNTSQITGETTELLVTPLLSLEVYADGELIGVFPYTEDDETYTTNEVIAELRTGEVPTPLGQSATQVQRPTDDCPACGGPLVDGQGVFACGECGWIGTLSASGEFVDRIDSRPATEASVRLPDQ